MMKAMAMAGYPIPGKRVFSKMINDARKMIAKSEAKSEREEPEVIARKFIDENWMDKGDLRRLHFLVDQFYMYNGRYYVPTSDSSMRLELTGWLQANETRITRSLVDDVLLNVRALCKLPDDTKIPSWIGEDPTGRNCSEWLVFGRGLLRVQDAIEARFQFEDHSPVFLATGMMPFRFFEGIVPPKWQQFLDETFAGDQQRIIRLQE